MQSIRPLNKIIFANLCWRQVRCFAVTHFSRQIQQQPSNGHIPWFVDPYAATQTHGQRPTSSQLQKSHKIVPIVPEDAPDVVKHLHSHLIQSPHLELSELVVSPAVAPAPGPPLPLRAPRGRRKRGATYFGESAFETPAGGLWNWVVVAQVKEGTESRGAIESVIRLVRKSLLSRDPPVPLAPKRKAHGSEWVLIDAGDFAIHIVSKAAREKYFSQTEW